MASQDELFAELFGGGSGSDVSDIGNFQKAVAANNIFSQLAPQVASAPFNTSNWSLGQTVGITAGKAFLSSLLNAIGQRQQSDQLNSLASVLPQLYEDPLAVSAPEGVDPQAFAGLKLSTLARADRSKSDALQSLMKEILSVKLAAPIAAAKARGELEGKNSFYNEQGTENPEDPAVKLRKSLETDTYNRITKLPSYIQFSDIDANFRTLKELSKETSRPASVGMISALARIWDPMGTVREGEYNINSQAQSALDSIIGNWKEIVLGEGKLSPESKQKIIGAAATKYNEFGNKYTQEKSALYDALKAQGGNPLNVPTSEYTPFELPQVKTINAPKDAILAELKRRGAIPQ